VSRIDELIAELCPDGVPYRELGDVASYSNSRIGADAVDSETFVGVDNLRPNQGGRTPSGHVPTVGNLTEYRAGDVLIGNIRPYLKKIWLATNRGGCSGDVLAVRIREPFSSAIMPEFLYRLLSAEAFFAYDMQHAKGAKMPRGNKPMILKYRIPVPPLEVQREIVRILDLFTTLEAELEAELEARRRQYAHYRDSLLTFPEGGVRWIPMGEVGSIFGGLTGKSKQDFSEGNARFISYVNVLNNVAVNVAANDFVRVEASERQRALRRGDILFTGSSETPNEVGMSAVVTADVREPLYLNSFCIGYRLHQADLLEPDFAKHLFRSAGMRSQIIRTASGVTRFNVSKSRLAKVLVPVPGLDEQRRIANILDKFDALVNDLSVGLPAELAARRTQYEYYRDRLLTFREAVA